MRQEEFVQRLRLHRGRRPARLPRLGAPQAEALGYYQQLQRTVLADFERVLEEELLPLLRSLFPEERGEGRREDVREEDALRAALRRLSEEFLRRWTGRRLSRVVQPQAARLAQASERDINRAFSWLSVGVVGSEPWLVEESERFVEENAGLIRSLGSWAFESIEQHLLERVAAGDRWEGMARALQERLGVTKSRAKLIARDQTGKYYARLNQVRFEELGLERYTWRTVRDNRVREAHESLDGKSFSWGKPPKEGHPGQAVQCRCYAEPDVEALLRQEGVPVPDELRNQPTPVPVQQPLPLLPARPRSPAPAPVPAPAPAPSTLDLTAPLPRELRETPAAPRPEAALVAVDREAQAQRPPVTPPVPAGRALAPRAGAEPSRAVLPETQPEQLLERVKPVRRRWKEGKVFLVPVAELDDVPALAWQPGRAESVERAVTAGKAEELPEIQVVTAWDGTRELQDGNHRLATFRKFGVRHIKVRFLDEDASRVRARPPRKPHFMELERERKPL